MVRRGFIREVNKKIDKILELCSKHGLSFDNSIPNKYTIIGATGNYVFSTYKDVINALELFNREK